MDHLLLCFFLVLLSAIEFKDRERLEFACCLKSWPWTSNSNCSSSKRSSRKTKPRKIKQTNSTKYPFKQTRRAKEQLACSFILNNHKRHFLLKKTVCEETESVSSFFSIRRPMDLLLPNSSSRRNNNEKQDGNVTNDVCNARSNQVHICHATNSLFFRRLSLKWRHSSLVHLSVCLSTVWVTLVSAFKKTHRQRDWCLVVEERKKRALQANGRSLPVATSTNSLLVP